MILDLDGAASEPSRRRHVAVLSAAVAVISLVILVVLIDPAPRNNPLPLGASAAPSPTNGQVFLSLDSAWSPFGRGSPLVSAERLSDSMTTLCIAPDGSRVPLQLNLYDRNGQPLNPSTTSTEWSTFRPQVWVAFRVSCNATEDVAPRLDRAR